MQRYTICVYAVPFGITLSHFTQHYTVCMYAVPFDITLSHFTQRYTVCAYAVLLDITLSHLTQRYTVCVVYCNGRPIEYASALGFFYERWKPRNEQLAKMGSFHHMCLDSALALWSPGHSELGFFASRIRRSEMECSALGFSYERWKRRNGQLAKMRPFHQSKRSDNKRYAVEVRWGIFFENLTYYFIP